MLRVVLRIGVWKVLASLDGRLVWATTISSILYLKNIATQLRCLLTRSIALSFQLHRFGSVLISKHRIICAMRSRSGCFTWTLVWQFLLVFLLQDLSFYLACVILGPFEYMFDWFVIIVIFLILFNFLLDSFNYFLVWRFLFVFQSEYFLEDWSELQRHHPINLLWIFNLQPLK